MSVLAYIKCLLEIIISTIMMYISYVFLPKNIWLISERANQAQDNGKAFFEYLSKNEKDVASYYLIQKGNPQIKELKKIGKIILLGSWKHKVLFLKSNVIATTEKNIIEPWGSNVFYKYFAKFYPKKTRVFLQHGILAMDVSSVYGKAVSHFDLFVTSTQKEKKFVEEVFGYLPEEVICTGISRYDSLEYGGDQVEKERTIVYMPTWRRYLIDLANQDKAYIEKARQAFCESQYYHKINELLKDEKLNGLLEKHNFELIYIAHHGMSSFLDLLQYNSKRIKIYESESINIQQMLKKAQLFITDYSSVHFDSAYLGNTNFYYQFDKDRVLKEHAKEMYFNYEKDGFGKVVYDKEMLLQSLEQALVYGEITEDKYEKRRELFFEYRDRANSRRIYEKIIEKRKKHV